MRRSAHVALGAALWAVACASPEAPADAGQDAETGDEKAPASGRMGLMGSILKGQGGQPAPYEEPPASPDFDAAEDHYAVVELSEPVVELSSLSIFGAAGVELRQVLETLRELSAAERVEGLVLRLSEPRISMSAAEELRSALLAFKEGGERRRPVICHAERASAIGYYVLTACDRIGLAPLGEIAIAGVDATPIHIRGLLDKLGVLPQFATIGEYKTAAEPLTRERPSPQLRATLEAVLDTQYRTIVRGIAEGRGLSPAAVGELIDGGLYQGERAEEAKLVDAVSTFSAYRSAALEGAPWRREALNGALGQPDVEELMRFLGLTPKRRPSGERVAVVYMVGAVVEGEGAGDSALRQQIASRQVVSAIRVLAEDDSVKAVVARIDSPGGSALASEQIWLALAELADEKPLIVSMGRVAASGGYYIASPAETIYALENTLTGSIGVVGGKLVIDEGLEKLGIAAYPMGRGERSLLGSPFVAWDEEELGLIRSLMQSTYARFVDRVAQGRDLPRAQVLEVAGGRLWTGAAAAERELVDRIGGLDAALAEARDRGGVDVAAPVEVYPPEPSLLDLLASVGGAAAPSRAGLTAEVVARFGAELARLDPPRAAAILDLVALASSLARAPITATAFTAAALR